MHSADYAVQSVCPSVCLSVTRRYYVYTVITFKLFPPSGSPTILAFPHQVGWQYSDRDPLYGDVECKGVWKKITTSTSISLYLGNNARQSHSYYGRRIGNRTQALEWYRSLNDLEWFQGHNIIRRQITRKMVQHRAILTMADQQKVVYSNGATFNDHYPDFKVTPFFDAEYLRNGTRYRYSFNGILIAIYTRPTQPCHFEWEWS